MTQPSDSAVATTLFVAVASLVGVDLLSDVGSGVEPLHVGAEGLAAAISILGAVVFYRYHVRERAEADAWRAQAEELLQGMGSAVDRQFEVWSLSKAEAEVALLLLKGLAFKEIAAVRGTSERTNREQARGVYKKAGVAGRAELSAWFMEDFLSGGSV